MIIGFFLDDYYQDPEYLPFHLDCAWCGLNLISVYLFGYHLQIGVAYPPHIQPLNSIVYHKFLILVLVRIIGAGMKVSLRF